MKTISDVTGISYEIEDVVLKIPSDEKDRETDIYNSILLYERLNKLPLYVLTDERFWCWMMFEKGYEVALKYMPVKKGSSVFKDHWLLTQGKRRGLFFGVLSRCYFRVCKITYEFRRKIMLPFPDLHGHPLRARSKL